MCDSREVSCGNAREKHEKRPFEMGVLASNGEYRTSEVNKQRVAHARNGRDRGTKN